MGKKDKKILVEATAIIETEKFESLYSLAQHLISQIQDSKDFFERAINQMNEFRNIIISHNETIHKNYQSLLSIINHTNKLLDKTLNPENENE